MPLSDYKQAYESAKQELAELVASQDRTAKRIMTLRESLKILATLCESEEVKIEPSAEAAYLLEHSPLADEIKGILRAHWSGWLRPHQIKTDLERLGHDLSKYQNPQAAIHMALKRMVQSGEVQEMVVPDDGKQTYRCPPLHFSISSKAADAMMAAMKKQRDSVLPLFPPPNPVVEKFLEQMQNNPLAKSLAGKKLNK